MIQLNKTMFYMSSIVSYIIYDKVHKIESCSIILLNILIVLHFIKILLLIFLFPLKGQDADIC